MAVYSFPFSQVRLTGGPFARANRLTADYLLSVDPHRLLHSFRKNAGLEPKAPIYGGWESLGLAGHSLGHYMTACAQEFAASGDDRFREKVDLIVDELAECQSNRSDGYLGAMPDGDRVWDEVRRGEIRTGGFDLNGLWAPWYTHHKVFAGLFDAHDLCKNVKALAVAKVFGDWAILVTENLSAELWEEMLACEYGGMNEAMADLFARTGESKYLDLARKFYDKRVLDPLSRGENSLPGKHSNTQIPKIIGLARLYEVDGSEKDRRTAEFFWRTMVNDHSYVIGGNSNHEYLGEPKKLSNALSTNTSETCNTYNMLRLTEHLFTWDPKPEYFDYYERAHLNHILASQNPDDGMVTYFVPLGSGARRFYSNREEDWTCCHGTGMENHTKHGGSIYFHDGQDKLYVNLFIPSHLTWEEKGIDVEMETQYPLDGKVAMTIGTDSPAKFELAIRHPAWCRESVTVRVNGSTTAISNSPGSYFVIAREWNGGDRVEFEFPMSLHTEAMPDNPRRIALMFGPLVLAADLGPDEGESPRKPVLITGRRPIQDWLSPIEGCELAFKSSGVGRPSDMVFRPFYQLSEARYAVYFDDFTLAEWEAEESAYRLEEERIRDLESRTVDFMRIAEMQPERDHRLTSESNDVREANGRSFRTPLKGGWFEFDIQVDPDLPTDLVFTYWGNERTQPDFSISVDGVQIAEETLLGRPFNCFFDVVYPLPPGNKHTSGDVKRVRIQAKPGKAAGSFTAARTVRKVD